MQNDTQDNSFLLEKKDKCCGQKCGCHKENQESQENGDFMDNSIDCPDISFIYLVILCIAALIFGIVITLCYYL